MEVFGFLMLLFKRHGGVIGSFLCFLPLSDTRSLIYLSFSWRAMYLYVQHKYKHYYSLKIFWTTTDRAQRYMSGWLWSALSA